jgi:hypothetical protein
LPPLFAQNTDAGFASAQAVGELMTTSMATTVNAIDLRISFSRFVSVFDAPFRR